jgi:hypothetical protein
MVVVELVLDLLVAARIAIVSNGGVAVLRRRVSGAIPEVTITTLCC